MRKDIDIATKIKQLMMRDPLFLDFQRKYREYFNAKNPPPNGCFDPPAELQKLADEVGGKWAYSVLANFTSDNEFVVQKDSQWVKLCGPSKLFIGKKLIRDDVFTKQAGHLYLDIDLSMVNIKKDKDRLIAMVWNKIETAIRKRDDGKTVAQMRQPIPDHDSPDLAPIYHTSKFSDYLEWYDLHMGQDYSKPKGLNFRQIAVVEIARKKYPERLAEVRDKVAKEHISTSIGEDKIEKGIKMIYQAIHRKPYPARKAFSSVYACPDHPDSECSPDCKTLLDFMKRANKALWKPSRKLFEA